MIKSVVISSGHGKYVRGASGIIDEVEEARRVVDAVARLMQEQEVRIKTFHDNTSYSQDENLRTIVDYHNSQERDLDISIHFNAYEQVDHGMGCEVLYTSQRDLAAEMSAAIAGVGFIDRGAKQRTDLYFLNNTDAPAILIEVCFVDSMEDCDVYENNFDEICESIVAVLTGEEEVVAPLTTTFMAVGPCSHFGGPNDKGVDVDEGLAFISSVDQAPYLFLPETDQTEGLGLARRLNPFVHYVACRWDYNVTPKDMLLKHVALVRSLDSGRTLKAFPADWGPHEDTGRVADLSPGLMEDLQLQTDDDVEVFFPFEEFEGV